MQGVVVGKRTCRVVAGAVVVGIVLVGCGEDRNDSLQGAGSGTTKTTVAATASFQANKIAADVREWHVGLTANTAKAGEVTFAVTNFGTQPHEFLVVATDFEIGQIPIRTDNRFDEEEPGLNVVNEIPEWEPGVTNSLTVDLAAGHYQLVCNISGHYPNGMFAEFEVIE
jgi:uncharacterized cupredoxin-like copper-binding protein